MSVIRMCLAMAGYSMCSVGIWGKTILEFSLFLNQQAHPWSHLLNRGMITKISKYWRRTFVYFSTLSLQVDDLSPKICYFANETVTDRYQIIAILCKTADASFKLVSSLQQRLDSQGYYRSHSQWLKNGSFSNAQEEVTPKSKHKTIASVEIVSSPKQSTKFGWGVSQSRTLPQVPSTPDSVRANAFWNTHLSTKINNGSANSSETGSHILPSPMRDSQCVSTIITNGSPVIPCQAFHRPSSGFSILPDRANISTSPLNTGQRPQEGTVSPAQDNVRENIVVMRRPKVINKRLSLGELEVYIIATF